MTFDDIARLDDNSMQRLLKAVDGNVFAVALKGASNELLARIYSNLSARAVALLKEDIALGPTRTHEVEEAQQQVVELVHTLAESGEVLIPRRSRR